MRLISEIVRSDPPRQWHDREAAGAVKPARKREATHRLRIEYLAGNARRTKAMAGPAIRIIRLPETPLVERRP